MNPLKFYKVATWVMLVLNLSLLAFVFLGTGHRPPPKGAERHFQKMVVNELLQLDAAQKAAFRQFAKAHHEKMKAANSRQRALLKPYFYSIVDSSSVVDREVMFAEFLALERHKVETTFGHFGEVKSVLEKEQLEGFGVFVNRAVDRLLF